VVADTNTVVSGLLWRGNPRQVLEAARIGTLQLYTTASLLAEIEDVLQRLKFARRLSLAGVTSSSLVMGYAARARLIEPAVIEPVSQHQTRQIAIERSQIARPFETGPEWREP
jgi:putative PIN family toxin of toxin-antitoxin system